MSATRLARLDDQGVISVTGPDAKSFLDNLLTNDMDLLDRQSALHAALLTPQGKILFAFLVVKTSDGYLLETDRASVPGLLKRLTLYKLRAKVALDDLSASRSVLVAWDGPPPEGPPEALAYPDPRAAGFATRLNVPAAFAADFAQSWVPVSAYDLHRIAHAIPEAGRDYLLGDTFPHEANFDRLAGVSFTKGCFVGQEVVARMQHKSVSRKRVVRVTGAADLAEGAAILIGEAVIGRIGTTVDQNALALLRLDRAAEARSKGLPLTAGGVPLTVDAASLDAYEHAVANRPASLL